jgi:hypothetical protein
MFFLSAPPVPHGIGIKKAHIAVSLILIGGRDWNRTSDTRIFNPLLYRLSYSAFMQNLQVPHYSKQNLSWHTLDLNFMLILSHLILFFCCRATPFEQSDTYCF